MFARTRRLRPVEVRQRTWVRLGFPSRLGRLVTLCWAVGAIACATAPTAIQEPHPEMLVQLAKGYAFKLVVSPDGYLFASTSAGLLRASVGQPRNWDVISVPPFFVVGLYAPSRNLVYALARNTGSIFRWDSTGAWTQVYRLPVGSSTNPIWFQNLWARTSADIEAVGFAGSVLHFDGTTWSRDTSVNGAISDTINARGHDMYGLSGNDTATWIGGAVLLQQIRAGPWSQVQLPAALSARCSSFVALAADHSSALIASNNCLLRLDGALLRVLSNDLPGVRTPITFGQAQLDSSGLFWTYGGDVVRSDHGRIRVYEFMGVGAVGGAVSTGGWIYVAGTTLDGGSGVVVRVRE